MSLARNLFWGLGTASMRNLPPEPAHDLGVACLKYGLSPRSHAKSIQRDAIALGVDLSVDIPGMGKVLHPIGLAAGFDKDAECILGCERVGFSFVEVGTVTPLAQPGNAKPRLWRQKKEQALVNAMGFNNNGIARAHKSVAAARKSGVGIPVGVNIGKNKATPPQNALEDYAKGFEGANGVADFFVVNVSSPNTPGLRDLATPKFIQELSLACGQERRSRTWIKLSPDMERTEFQALIESVAIAKFAGVVLSNTHKVESPWQGGQSGRPILSLSNTVLEWGWQVHRGALPTIASGGVFSGADSLEKIIRGAMAVEIFTAFIYRGPLAVKMIANELALELKQRGFSNLAEARGTFFK